MRKVIYKFIVAIVFSIFGIVAKLFFSSDKVILEKLFFEKEFWTVFLIFLSIGYVILGNIVWVGIEKNRMNKN